eukprot:Selendium_serpulae@DN6169_c2_g2_i13.p1
METAQPVTADSAKNSVSTESPQNYQPSAFLPPSNSVDARRKKAQVAWAVGGCSIGLLLIVGAFLILFFEALLPPITQKVIDDAELQLQAVTIGDPTAESFNLTIDADLVRQRGIPAKMHDTYLNVFVDDPNFVEAEQAAEDDAEAASVKGRRRRLQGGAEGTEDPLQVWRRPTQMCCLMKDLTRKIMCNKSRSPIRSVRRVPKIEGYCQ